ncbi:carbohydrate ABC transporter permease [Cohnella ginsengisoli]|uniref:Carbohydrate ABC transporter permease n=1 Tax=Cohnella ginsengisoli TaxID=425004 RepID=A0A9X4QMM7_9BACL|nr:carbohydrate ABC transporter permease [Cohnella ginsengisoli]MDG0791407.1 carbohydrate ABC transporter permease [Cohnella ginsengisoli]
MENAIKLRQEEKAAERPRKAYQPNAVSRPAHAAINVLFVLYTLFCLLPILLVVIVSFTDEQTVLLSGYNYFPSKLSLDAYRFLFADPLPIVRAYGVTIGATVAGTVVGLLVTAAFAYPISRRDFRFRNVFSFFAFFTMLFNGGLVPWYIVYSKYMDIGNTILALILPNLLMSAFYILMMRTFFATTIPAEIYESAEIDGAGELLVFFRIVIPLSLPVMATVGLFYTLQYWNDWYNSMIFINNDRIISLQYLMQRTLLNIQYILNNSHAAATARIDFPSETVRMAMAVIGIGPIVFAYPFFQRYFVSGLTVGAVKG